MQAILSRDGDSNYALNFPPIANQRRVSLFFVIVFQKLSSLMFEQSVLTMIPVITSFLPPTHIHLYVPALFKIWEAFNSSVIDERLIDLAGELSEEHVSGKAGIAGVDGGAEWKDVGIWTEDQWSMLIGQGLASMSAAHLTSARLSAIDCNCLCRCSRRSYYGEAFTVVWKSITC